MGKTIIPKKTEIRCDFCKLLCSNGFGKGRRVMEGEIIIKRHALDYLGDPAADGTKNIYTCDACLEIVIATLNRLAETGDNQMRTIDIVFDGPPSAVAGRFVEVEDDKGNGLSIGEWIDRGNGLWALRITKCVKAPLSLGGE